MTAEYAIGILFSASGFYGAVGRTMRNGADLACRQVNADPASGIRLSPVFNDPGSDLAAYAPAVEDMLAANIRQIVGCYTSASRKEVIPLFEKHDALLWYPAHYEGFESSDNVIYTGASPNHHMLPLVDYLVAHAGRKAFCVGSNYVWAWESNRVLREEIIKRGGTVVAERYLALGETDVDRIIDAIFEADPDFVFNALIGESAYAFFRAFRKACIARGIDQVERYPVASCNLSEPELHAIGGDAAAGHLSASVYFASIDTRENRSFVSEYNEAFPDGPAPSAEAEAAYIAVKLLARSLAAAGTDALRAVKAHAANQTLSAPQGKVVVDPATYHTYLTPRIGRSLANNQFEVVYDAGLPVRPDPYLVNSSSTLEAATRHPNLRIVS
ncbi:MAG: transporter substrate-binding domain-containing protein [Shinella sp.]|nr:transporter substrate-binding domain-containing protein [Shinella sp.]